MNYLVSEKGGERVKISLRESGEGIYEITLDGRTVHVDAVRSGPTVYSVIEDGRQFEAMVDEKGAHGFDVLVAGRLFHLESLDERTQLLAQTASAAPTGPQSIVAEMPGKVVKISVASGEAVREGQGVVILEAMKMENEIPSPIAGTVKDLPVGEGQTVEAGTLLFTVVP